MKLPAYKYLTTGLVMATAASLHAEDPPSSAPATNALASAQSTPVPPPQQPWYDNVVAKTVTQGKLLIDARLRYERADTSSQDAGNAFTIRTRLGYQTAPLYGFQALLEFEDVSIIGSEDNYNQAELNPGAAGKSVVADPETTEVNRAWIGYNNYDTLAKLGRQRIILDDSRFVGNVGWRQNEQTFDGFSVQNKSLDDTTLFYGYVHNVNRFFGDDHPAGDFESNSHLFDISNSSCPYATIGLYSYLLDLDDAPANSSATYGARLTGVIPVNEEQKASLNYRLQYALQQDYKDQSPDYKDQSPDYDAHYFKAELGGTCQIYNMGAGYEVLGSHNDKGFSTPFATLHAFNGWADVFLATPAEGLEDIYAWAGVKLPWDMPLKVVFHSFSSQQGNDDYGYELDAVISKKFGKHWTVLAKYAYYDGKDDPFAPGSAIDVHKGWLQVGFSY